MDVACRTSVGLCLRCAGLREDLLKRLPPRANNLLGARQALTQNINDLSKKLNALPAKMLPTWVSDLSLTILPRLTADMVAKTAHETCSGEVRQRNVPASAVLLVMLMPKVFSMMPAAEAVPLRIFGHPPAFLLRLHERCSTSPADHDQWRNDVMEALTTHFLDLRDRQEYPELAGEMAEALQNCWKMAKNACDAASTALDLCSDEYDALQVVMPMQQLLSPGR
jgi:hypothetical protein